MMLKIMAMLKMIMFDAANKEIIIIMGMTMLKIMVTEIMTLGAIMMYV